MPNSPAWIAGTTLYKKEAITIVDISKVLAVDSAEHHAASQRQQMILLKTGGSQAKIALVVDELGEIPSLPVIALNESENLTTQGNIIQALVKTSNNLLVVLNTEQLLKQLEQGIKKPLSEPRGFFRKHLRGELTLIDWLHVAVRCTVEQLTWTTDFVFGVCNHFVQLGDPAHGAGQRENRCKQWHGNTDRLLNDTGIEIHVRVQLALYKVFVFQRNFSRAMAILNNGSSCKPSSFNTS